MGDPPTTMRERSRTRPFLSTAGDITGNERMGITPHVSDDPVTTADARTSPAIDQDQLLVEAVHLAVPPIA
jgi:hypothetical protein